MAVNVHRNYIQVPGGCPGFLPRAHAQGAGVKHAIADVTTIARYRSRVLRIYACCNYHELVDIDEKLASVRFELLNMAH